MKRTQKCTHTHTHTCNGDIQNTAHNQLASLALPLSLSLREWNGSLACESCLSQPTVIFALKPPPCTNRTLFFRCAFLPLCAQLRVCVCVHTKLFEKGVRWCDLRPLSRPSNSSQSIILHAGVYPFSHWPLPYNGSAVQEAAAHTHTFMN